MDYFYPRPLRRGRLAADTRGLNYVVISIHALFAEGDEYKRIIAGYIDISIHALFAEGDDYGDLRRHAASRFLSTPSSQRATANMPNSIRHI